MSRIKRVVDVERDPFRDLPERLAGTSKNSPLSQFVRI
jgi:hypothetical protein